MPLQYDNEPGSWGRLSQDWPKLVLPDDDEAERAFIACSKGRLVPYGSYVLAGLELRCEREQYVYALAKYLVESPYQTYEELRDHYKETGEWGN